MCSFHGQYESKSSPSPVLDDISRVTPVKILGVNKQIISEAVFRATDSTQLNSTQLNSNDS